MRAWSFAALLLSLTIGCHSPAKPVSFQNTGSAEATTKSDYQALLARYVSDSGVDYDGWHKSSADVQKLDAYLGLVTQRAPNAAPQTFATPESKLAYWIDLYNALVIREVLRRWPLDSVRDVRPSLFRPGKGFFAELRFRVGGKILSLDDIEHKIIRSQFKDARIHFAINCGSASCPVLDSTSYASGDLDQALDRATQNFINTNDNVRIDDKSEEIVISKIFKWYEEDFAHTARAKLRNPSATVLDFIEYYSDNAQKIALTKARRAGYDIEYADYDWSVNKGDVAGADTTQSRESSKGVGKALPALSLRRIGGGSWTPEESRGKLLVLDVWATYCKPCRKSMPELVALAEKHPESVQVVAVGVDESEHQIRDFLGPDMLASRVIFVHDPEQAVVGDALSVATLPTELIVDRQGMVRRRVEGAANAEKLISPFLKSRAD